MQVEVEVEVATEAEILDTAGTMIITAEVVVDMVDTVAEAVLMVDLTVAAAVSMATKADLGHILEAAGAALDKEVMLSDLETGPAHHATPTTLRPVSSACAVGCPNLLSEIPRQRHLTMATR